MECEPSTIRALLRAGADPNLPNDESTKMAPLHAATYKNNLVVMQMLLNAGARVSSPESFLRQTPLHIAAHAGHVKAVALLLRVGAKVMPRDEGGKTPLDLAESGEVIKLLKGAGAREQ